MATDFFPMTTAELMDRTIDIYKKSFGKHIAFASIAGVVYAIVAFFATIFLVLGATFFTNLSVQFSDTATGAFLSAMFIWVVIILPMFFLWLSLSSAGHILLSRQSFYGHRARLAVGQLPRVVGRILGALVAIAIACMPFVVFLSLTAASQISEYLLYDYPWVLLISSVLFVACFAIYTNIFSLSIAVAVCENKTFVSAVLRSWDLIKGEFWKIAGVRLLWFISVLVILVSGIGALGLINVLVVFLLGLANLGDIGMVLAGINYLITGVGTLAIVLAILPLDGIFHATLYYNQRIKKEGLDIEIRLGRLPS